MPDPVSRDMARRYLLGDLSETERDAVGRRVVEEEEAFAVVREVEDDLIDSLARGELRPQEEAAVRRFLSESGQNDRTRFARALAAGGRRTYSGAMIVRVFVALAAILFLGLVGAFYAYRKPGLTMPPIAGRPLPAPKPAVVFTITLPPGTVRGPERVTRVRIPEGTELVKVPLAVEAGFPAYSVRLKGEGNRELYAAQPERAGAFDFTFTAALVPAGKYEIEVTGNRKGAPPEPLAYHYFAVEAGTK